MRTISIPIPSTSPNPTPLQVEVLEHGCWQMEALNAILEASFLPVKKDALQQTDQQKEVVTDASSETLPDSATVDLVAVNAVTRPTIPPFSPLGFDMTSGSNSPTCNERSSPSSPNNNTLVSREKSEKSMSSCSSSVRKVSMTFADAVPTQRRNIATPSPPSPVDSLPSPLTRATDIEELENLPVRRVKRKPAPPYLADLLGDLASPGPCLQLGPTLSSPSHRPPRLLTPACQRKGLDIADYELKKVLAYGGQGKVYLASFLHSLVAVKVVDKRHLEKDPVELDFVLQEQRVLRMLRSPFILSLEASFSDSDFFYLVTEYHGGGELHQALASAGKFDESTARFYAAEMALGIDHLHKNGIVHRDIKLMNVLIKKDGHVAIADLGLVLDLWSPVRVKESDATLPTCCGTVPYMSPEVLEGKSHGEPVDLWALGVCTYLMLTGSLPWHGGADKETIHMILEAPVPFTAESPLTAAARLLVCQLLIKDPSFRLTMNDLKHHPFFHDMDWRALERLQVRPPFVPTDCRLSLARATLSAHERFTPGVSMPPFFVDKYPEYTYSKLNHTAPTMRPRVAVVTPVSTVAESISVRGAPSLARSDRALPPPPSPGLALQLPPPEPPAFPIAEPVQDDIMVSIKLATSRVRHHPQIVYRSRHDHRFRKGWTQARLYNWFSGLGRGVVSAFPRRSAVC